jgi:hypothetical protein
MNNIDKRGKLNEEPFTFRKTKDGKVLLYWHGRQVMILKEHTAEKFLQAVMQADSHETQLLMARATGHFKHGSERKISNKRGE